MRQPEKRRKKNNRLGLYIIFLMRRNFGLRATANTCINRNPFILQKLIPANACAHKSNKEFYTPANSPYSAGAPMATALFAGKNFSGNKALVYSPLLAQMCLKRRKHNFINHKADKNHHAHNPDNLVHFH